MEIIIKNGHLKFILPPPLETYGPYTFDVTSGKPLSHTNKIPIGFSTGEKFYISVADPSGAIDASNYLQFFGSEDGTISTISSITSKISLDKRNGEFFELISPNTYQKCGPFANTDACTGSGTITIYIKKYAKVIE